MATDSWINLFVVALSFGLLSSAAAERTGSQGGGSGGGALSRASGEVRGSSSPSGGSSSSGPGGGGDGGGRDHGSGQPRDGTARQHHAPRLYDPDRGLFYRPYHDPFRQFSGGEAPGDRRFRPYPYAEGLPGHRLRVQTSVDDSYDFQGVNRLSATVSLASLYVFGVETRWSHFAEFLPDGLVDQIGLGDLDLSVNLGWTPVHLALLGGPRFFLDPAGVVVGWNAGLDLQAYPVRPMVFELRGDYGRVGEAAMVHLRGQLGAVFYGIEPYLGYDYLTIGSVKIHGPLLGLRYWVS